MSPVTRIQGGGPIGWVLFDGGCGACSKWVPYWGPTLAKLGIGTRPLQDPWVAERTGMDEESLVSDIRLIFADGRHLVGAEVYRWVMRRLWWAWPIFVLSLVPGFRQLFDASYRAFVRNRLKVSEACGWEPLIPPGARR